MSYKQNFIKRDRVDSNEIPTIKDTYDRISEKGFPNKTLRKNEPFVLMFRDFIFFDVKSYECRKGDLYIRNIVDGIVLKRYFRMDSDDQLTVFKNRSEFDEFMDKVKEEGYMFGPEAIKKVPVFDTDTGTVFKNREEFVLKNREEFVLNNFSGIRNSETGKIDVITSTWDGTSVTRDECPDLFDEVVQLLETNVGSAQILTKKDFM